VKGGRGEEGEEGEEGVPFKISKSANGGGELHPSLVGNSLGIRAEIYKC
jgi:hypothetical protein